MRLAIRLGNAPAMRSAPAGASAAAIRRMANSAVCAPSPSHTPVRLPAKRPPAIAPSSSAPSTTSRMRRCCGSTAAASASDRPNGVGSNARTSSKKAPAGSGTPASSGRVAGTGPTAVRPASSAAANASGPSMPGKRQPTPMTAMGARASSHPFARRALARSSTLRARESAISRLSGSALMMFALARLRHYRGIAPGGQERRRSFPVLVERTGPDAAGARPSHRARPPGGPQAL